MLSEMKERKTPEAMEKWEMRVASGGIRTHDTLHSGQMLYQLSYQGIRINISYACMNRLTWHKALGVCNNKNHIYTTYKYMYMYMS